MRYNLHIEMNSLASKDLLELIDRCGGQQHTSATLAFRAAQRVSVHPRVDKVQVTETRTLATWKNGSRS